MALPPHTCRMKESNATEQDGCIRLVAHMAPWHTQPADCCTDAPSESHPPTHFSPHFACDSNTLSDASTSRSSRAQRTRGARTNSGLAMRRPAAALCCCLVPTTRWKPLPSLHSWGVVGCMERGGRARCHSAAVLDLSFSRCGLVWIDKQQRTLHLVQQLGAYTPQPLAPSQRAMSGERTAYAALCRPPA